MSQFLSAFLFTLAVTFLSTPLTIILAKKFNLLDDPKLRPHPAHIHKKTVPRAGGLPIFLGIVLSMLLFTGISQIMIGIILSLTILLVVGLLDDALVEFKPGTRLALQFIPAVIAVLSGIGIDFITNPLGGILRLDGWRWDFLGFQINIIADLFAILWIVWIQNCVNWSKGVDGQMPTITFVSFLTIGFVSLNFLNLGDSGQYLPTLLAFIGAGASLGFLLFNFHPAKIFPGFSGSTILGFMIAVLSIFSSAKLAVALLVLLIPAVDFFYTFFRRILERKSPLKGDRKHLHHLLLKRGFTSTQITLLYGASCATLGMLAANLKSQGKIFTIILVGVIVLTSLLWLHLLSNKEEQNDAE